MEEAAPSTIHEAEALPDVSGSPYMKMSFFVLDRDKTPRKQIISFVTHPYFDTTVLTLILLNCLTMTVRVHTSPL